jgi:hypothetical protein
MQIVKPMMVSSGDNNGKMKLCKSTRHRIETSLSGARNNYKRAGRLPTIVHGKEN